MTIWFKRNWLILSLIAVLAVSVFQVRFASASFEIDPLYYYQFASSTALGIDKMDNNVLLTNHNSVAQTTGKIGYGSYLQGSGILKQAVDAVSQNTVGVDNFYSNETASTDLYSQTTQSTNSNYNDGSVANRNYAWSFVASANGTPNQIKLYVQAEAGSATGEVYIKSDKTFSSTSYGSATGLSFQAGENVISLTGGQALTSGTTYWVYVRFTSNSSNYVSFQYDTSKTASTVWRPTSSNIDPDQNWYSYQNKMVISYTYSSVKSWSASVWGKINGDTDYENAFFNISPQNIPVINLSLINKKPTVNINNGGAVWTATNALSSDDVSNWGNYIISGTTGSLSTDFKVYFNGSELAGSWTGSPDTNINRSSYDNISIGSRENSSSSFNGDLDDLAFFNYKLSSTEISSISSGNSSIGFLFGIAGYEDTSSSPSTSNSSTSNGYFSVSPQYIVPINFSPSMLYLYDKDYFSSTDTFSIYQCAGENYAVPNCSLDSSTLISTSTIWSGADTFLNQAGSGQGYFSLTASSTVFRSYFIRPYKSGTATADVYFSVQFASNVDEFIDLYGWSTTTPDDILASSEYVCSNLADSGLFDTLLYGLCRVALPRPEIYRERINDLRADIGSRFPWSVATSLIETFKTNVDAMSTTTSTSTTGYEMTIASSSVFHGGIKLNIFSATSTDSVMGGGFTNWLRTAMKYALIIAFCVFLYFRVADIIEKPRE